MIAATGNCESVCRDEWRVLFVDLFSIAASF
jgi:hypothetical protein